MKTNGKHTIDRKPLSTEEINRMQNFDAVLQGAKSGGGKGGSGKGGLGNGLYYAGGTLLILAGLAAWILLPLNKENAISRQVEQNIPETMPRTQEDSEDTVRAPLVRLPVNDWDIAFSRYSLDATKGGVITHISGTKIRIPASCLLDQNGNKVGGPVEFRYREFHDPIDIALSGITMHYDSAGKPYYFETAGMSELRAFQNNQELKIVPGKKIQIELVSQVGGSFNLYQLDEEKGWLARGSNTPKGKETEDDLYGTLNIPVPLGAEMLKERAYRQAEKEWQDLLGEKPKAPQKATISRPRFNLQVDLKDFPELEAFGTMEFEVAPEDKVFTLDLYKIQWNDVKLKRHSEKRYKMILTKEAVNKEAKQVVELIVIPVIAEKDFAQAQMKYDELLSDYNQRLEKKRKEADRLKLEAEKAQKEAEVNRAAQLQRVQEANQAQAAFIRTFTVDGFGIWNCDNPKLRYTRFVPCKFKDDKGNELPVLSANYVFPAAKGLMIIDGYGGLYQVPIINRADAYVLLMLEGNRIAFKKANDVKPAGGIEVMIPVSRTFANATEVKNFIHQAMAR